MKKLISYQGRHHNVFPQVRFHVHVHLFVEEFFYDFFLFMCVCLPPFFFLAMMNKYLIAITAQW